MTILTAGQDIYLRQGDTGNLTFEGLPKDKTYTAYLSIYNTETNTITKEIQAYSYRIDINTGVAYFRITATLSNSLPVGEWTYGLKICADDSEDTILPYSHTEDGTVINDDAPKFTVDYKYVEGTKQNA